MESSTPALIDTLLSDLGRLSQDSRSLAEGAQTSLQVESDPQPRRLAAALVDVHERTVNVLQIALRYDGLSAAPLDIGRFTESTHIDDDILSRLRRQVRRLEERCTSLIPTARDLGLVHVADALAAWSRALIGLENRVIDTHARWHHPAAA